MGQRLLISWVYYQPVGHAVEALRTALAFRNANPDLEISVALNGRSAPELAPCVHAIDTVYPIDVESVTSPASALAAIAAIPSAWDYLYADPRQATPMGLAALDYIAGAIRSTRVAGMANAGWDIPEGYPEQRVSPLVLELPAAAKHFAASFISRDRPVRVSLLLGAGSDAGRTPPLIFWRALIRELIAAFRGIEIVLLGALTPGRPVTQGIDRAAVDGLVQEFPQVRDAFDLGLLNQLAIAECCDLHISPHTGMAFAIQSVGVPWLALSGGEIHEVWLNGVPFVSVYPRCNRYPCGPWFDPIKNAMLPECGERRANLHPYLCMTDDWLLQRLPDIMQAARLLIESKLPYRECVRRHYQAMLPRLGKQDGDPMFFDWPAVMSDDFVYPERGTRPILSDDPTGPTSSGAS